MSGATSLHNDYPRHTQSSSSSSFLLLHLARSSNVNKVRLTLGGLLPLVLFATSRPVERHEEALLEYGTDWYHTFCRCVATGSLCALTATTRSAGALWVTVSSFCFAGALDLALMASWPYQMNLIN